MDCRLTIGRRNDRDRYIDAGYDDGQKVSRNPHKEGEDDDAAQPARVDRGCRVGRDAEHEQDLKRQAHQTIEVKCVIPEL